MWGLSRAEKTAVLNELTERKVDLPIFDEDYFNAGSNAQLRHVYEEGEKECPHFPDIGKGKTYRHECPRCWNELGKESGL